MTVFLTACPPPDSGSSFMGGTLSYIDCQAQTIGNAGYLALAGNGSPFAAFLTAMLTIFIAFIGYRMLAGRGPDLGAGLLAFAKIGIVLALATSWPAYRTLAYDTVIRTPAELGATIGGAASVRGAGASLAAGLADSDRAYRTLVAWGVGNQQTIAGTTDNQGIDPDDSYDAKALGGARMAFLAGSISSVAITRLGAGLLLALGPLFIAFLLFDATRGIFAGWLRGLIGLTLAATTSSLVLAVEMSLLQPRIVSLISLRAAGYSISGAPTELLALSVVFALVSIAIILLSFYVASGLRLPDWRWTERWLPASMHAAPATIDGRVAGQPVARSDPRSRAAAIVDAVAATQRREAHAGPAPGTGADRARTIAAASASPASSRAAVRPTSDGASAAPQRRRAVKRATASSKSRDER